MRFTNFNELFAAARNGNPVRVSLAAAHDEDAMLAVRQAVELDFIEPYFVGNEYEIRQIAEQLEFDLRDYSILPASTEEESAYLAAKLASDGTTQVIMKGFINSTPFLRGVLDKTLRLRIGRLLSHMSAFDIPGFHQLFYVTDGGLNIAPDLGQKEQILQNAIDFLHLIGIETPKVALLSANERINEKMPVTVECHTLSEMAKDGRFGSAVIEGPLPLDLAISKESLHHKGITSQLNGEADLLVVPNLETGNIFSKSITYFAKGIMAGLVLGAKVPLILNSRSDSAHAKLASIALSAVAVHCQEIVLHEKIS